MIPISVRARAYGPYDALDWSIPDGLTVVLGQNTTGDAVDSNGSGKTKLLESIPIALFGPELAWSEYLTVGAAEDAVCKVETEFAHRGERYRVRRTFSAKGRGKTSLDLEGWMPMSADPESSLGWIALSRETQAETQRFLEALIGLNKATFTHSVFSAQGARHFADPELPPRERKQIFTDALGLDIYSRMLELLRSDIRGVEAEAAVLDARMGDLSADLEREPELVSERDACGDADIAATRDLVQAEEVAQARREAYETAKEKQAAAETLAVRLSSAQAEFARLEGRVAEAELADDQIVTAEMLAATLQLQVDLIPALEQKLAAAEQAGSLSRERSALLAQSAQHTNRDQTLALQEETYRKRALEIRAEAKSKQEAEHPECDRCGQPIIGADLARTVAGMRADADNLVVQADGFRAEREEESQQARALKEQAEAIVIPEATSDGVDLAASLAVARQAVTEHAVALDQIRQLQETVSATRTDEFKAAWHAAEQDVRTAENALVAQEAPAQAQVTEFARLNEDATQALRVARAAAESAKITLARSEERLNQVASLRQRHHESQETLGQLNARLDLLKHLERSYGPAGIPTLIFEAVAVPQVETEAQRVLEALGVPFRIELRTQAETKAGTLRDTLDVVVHEPNGVRDYRTYSGGERSRLSVALRLGLARLLAHRQGAEIGMLILDELEALDVAGQIALVALLRDLQSEFAKIVVVSHDPLLADSFDQCVTVVKDDGRSRLEEAA